MQLPNPKRMGRCLSDRRVRDRQVADGATILPSLDLECLLRDVEGEDVVSNIVEVAPNAAAEKARRVPVQQVSGRLYTTRRDTAAFQESLQLPTVSNQKAGAPKKPTTSTSRSSSRSPTSMSSRQSPTANNLERESESTACTDTVDSRDSALAGSSSVKLRRLRSRGLTAPPFLIVPNSSSAGCNSDDTGANKCAAVVSSSIANILPEIKEKTKKNNCRLARMWLFGHINGETRPCAPAVLEQALESAVREISGSKDSLRELYNHWTEMDADYSGTISFEEFHYYSKILSRRPDRCEVLNAKDYNTLKEALFGDSDAFSVEHMLKIMYPAAKTTEISMMRSLLADIHTVSTQKKILEPAPLSAEELEGLHAVFGMHDEQGEGKLHISVLVNAGLVQPHELSLFRRRYDHNNTGIIDLATFCQLMCPAGKRTTIFATEGVSPCGQRIRYSEQDQKWHLDADQCKPNPWVTLDESAVSAAASKIQARLRGAKGRKLAAVARATKEQREVTLDETAATRIQAQLRGAKGRKIAAVARAAHEQREASTH